MRRKKVTDPIPTDGRSYLDAFRWAGLGIVALMMSVLLMAAGMFIGNGTGYYNAKSDAYSAMTEAETKQRVQDCFATTSDIDPAVCVREAIASGRDDERSEQDLGAQQEMAKWAFWLLMCTILQSLVGGLGFVALIITIRQGREANYIARQTAKTQLRAYLAGGGATISEASTDRGNCDQIVFNISNKGATPALMTKTTVQIWHVYAGKSNLIFERAVPAQSSVAGNVDDIMIPALLENEGDAEPIYLGAYEPGRFMISLLIEYRDVFDEEHGVRMLYSTGPGFWDEYPSEHLCRANDQGTPFVREISR